MFQPTRRTVLGACATALAASAVPAAVPSPAAADVTAAPYTRSTGLYRRTRWVRRQRRSFLLIAPGVRKRMTLVSVRDIPHAAAGSQRSFELVFRTASAGPEQGTYEARRSGFSRTSLFLVPTDESRRTYRATINNR